MGIVGDAPTEAGLRKLHLDNHAMARGQLDEEVEAGSLLGIRYVFEAPPGDLTRLDLERREKNGKNRLNARACDEVR
jgi:hypothetical protein